jgi:transposase-like protein
MARGQFTREFKLEAVQQSRARGDSVVEAARELWAREISR